MDFGLGGGYPTPLQSKTWRWREPLSSSKRCPKCGAHMVSTVAYDECPFCHYREVKPSAPATGRQYAPWRSEAGAASVEDQIHQAVQAGEEAQIRASGTRSAPRFISFNAPRETSAERGFLIGAMMVFVLVVPYLGYTYVGRGAHETAVQQQYYIWGLLAPLILHQFALNSTLLTLRWAMFGVALLQAGAELTDLTTQNSWGLVAALSTGLGPVIAHIAAICCVLTAAWAAWLYWREAQLIERG
jgi:hypothetical protein